MKHCNITHNTVIAALSFIGLLKFLFSLPEVKDKKDQKLAFLSNNLCQDPLEQFFGCQRQRGGTSDNPNVLEFCQNTQALRVIDSFCRAPVRGNCRKSNRHKENNNSLIPLSKRQRKK
jgi:hypothetical protein